MNKLELSEVIYEQIAKSISSINEERVDKPVIELNHSLKLFGDGGELDSLELVSLIVDLEQELSELLNVDICLTDDNLLSQEISPLSSVDNLINYIINLKNQIRNEI